MCYKRFQPSLLHARLVTSKLTRDLSGNKNRRKWELFPRKLLNGLVVTLGKVNVDERGFWLWVKRGTKLWVKLRNIYENWFGFIFWWVAFSKLSTHPEAEEDLPGAKGRIVWLTLLEFYIFNDLSWTPAFFIMQSTNVASLVNISKLLWHHLTMPNTAYINLNNDIFSIRTRLFAALEHNWMTI